MQQEEIEVQLWDYIDGVCSPADRQRIASLIAGNELWRSKFEELKSFQSAISHNLEAGQPSVRFTKNVMEEIGKTHIAPATKQYVNRHIILAIALFFIVTLILALGYAIVTANWQQTASNNLFPAININVNKFFDSSFVGLFAMANIILALVLADSLIRKNRRHVQH